MIRTILVTVVASVSLAALLVTGTAAAQTPRVLTLAPVLVVARATKPAAPRAERGTGGMKCHRHTLEQGGSPDAPSVRVCVFER